MTFTHSQEIGYSGEAFSQGPADFPMVSKRIDDSPSAPTILVSDGPDHGGAGRDGPFEPGIRIFHDRHHPHGAAAQSLGAEVLVLRRLVGHPEFGFTNGQASDHCSALVVDTNNSAAPKAAL